MNFRQQLTLKKSPSTTSTVSESLSNQSSNRERTFPSPKQAVSPPAAPETSATTKPRQSRLRLIGKSDNQQHDTFSTNLSPPKSIHSMSPLFQSSFSPNQNYAFNFLESSLSAATNNNTTQYPSTSHQHSKQSYQTQSTQPAMIMMMNSPFDSSIQSNPPKYSLLRRPVKKQDLTTTTTTTSQPRSSLKPYLPSTKKIIEAQNEQLSTLPTTTTATATKISLMKFTSLPSGSCSPTSQTTTTAAGSSSHSPSSYMQKDPTSLRSSRNYTDSDSILNESMLSRRSTMQLSTSRDSFLSGSFGFSKKQQQHQQLEQSPKLGEVTLSRRHQYSQQLANQQKLSQNQPAKKTPFTKICKLIEANLAQLSSKIKSKLPFFHQVSKLLVNKSLHLQNVIVIQETQEIIMDARTLDKSLVGVVTSAEFKQSPFAQRGMIKNLLVELNMFNKDVFALFLMQQQQSIESLREKIHTEQEHVNELYIRLSNKHYPNFDKKATLYTNFAFKSMPVSYKGEKYLTKEDQLGAFSLISEQNRFVTSKIDQVLSTLTERNYHSNNPYRKTLS